MAADKNPPSQPKPSDTGGGGSNPDQPIFKPPKMQKVRTSIPRERRLTTKVPRGRSGKR